MRERQGRENSLVGHWTLIKRGGRNTCRCALHLVAENLTSPVTTTIGWRHSPFLRLRRHSPPDTLHSSAPPTAPLRAAPQAWNLTDREAIRIGAQTAIHNRGRQPSWLTDRHFHVARLWLWLSDSETKKRHRAEQLWPNVKTQLFSPCSRMKDITRPLICYPSILQNQLNKQKQLQCC